MARDEKTDSESAALSRRMQRARATAGAGEEPPAQRPQPAPRILMRAERETLRARLQKKFH
jgi:hypothetical protein